MTAAPALTRSTPFPEVRDRSPRIAKPAQPEILTARIERAMRILDGARLERMSGSPISCVAEAFVIAEAARRFLSGDLDFILIGEMRAKDRRRRRVLASVVAEVPLIELD